MSINPYYQSKEHKRWRKAVFSRDNFTCQYPNCGSRKGIESHHIKPISKHKEVSTNVSLGITLCQECHEKTFGCEEQYEEMFMKIIEAKSKDVFSIKRFMYFGED